MELRRPIDASAIGKDEVGRIEHLTIRRVGRRQIQGVGVNEESALCPAIATVHGRFEQVDRLLPRYVMDLNAQNRKPHGLK